VSNSLRDVQALIIVDVQAAFVSGDEAVPEAAGLLVEVTGLLRRARETGALIIQRTPTTAFTRQNSRASSQHTPSGT
jgi:nicotinamidase-related amidase